ncbi:hypothetical protein GOP47_0021904 [Adiantum capillus-veneris]|uniref:Uncharacterized protein n=1 Tax=Adiantum capillus-veneris TaxID=13818 RepID=A0A9D4U983_ADICA|nr:hypothetical protein GOP47_0021904 [Adiantum capillus-veneris]
MAHRLRAAFDHAMGEEFELVDSEDDADDPQDGAREDEFGSDMDEEFDVLSGRNVDTTAAQARRGKDIQGIPWDRLRFTRKNYRENRLQQYKNYENLNVPRQNLEKECLQVEKGGKFYAFRHNTRTVSSTVVHFQLRNLVWATSKHDVYGMHDSLVWHWSPLSRRKTDVLNAARPFVPVPEARKSSWVKQSLVRNMQISTMCVKNNLLVAGGFQGEMVCKFLDRSGVSFCTKITFDENAITNAVEIYENCSGATRLMTSNNDSIVRVFDVERFEVLQKFHLPWPVNHTSVSPDNRFVVVVGDSADGFLADNQSGKVLAPLIGHLDYCFASAWHPNGHIFATGNQDTTCRLWDARNLSSSFAVLKGRIGAIRSLRFTIDGRFLAMAEPADFVHVFDVYQDFQKSQEIDIFGEIAGISFSPDSEALYIGVADRTYGSLLEYNRCHVNTYLDAMI